MDIIIKVARGKSIINFKVFNHTMDRAVTYKELLKKVKNKQYDIILLEEIDSDYLDTIREVSSYGRVALVCGRELEYAKQVETAGKIGIDVVAQAGELDDYIQKHTGNSIKFKGSKDGSSEYTEVEEYKDAPEYVDDDLEDEKVDIIIEEDTSENTEVEAVEVPVVTEEDDSSVEDIVNYALGNENKTAPVEVQPADLDIEKPSSEKDSLKIEMLQDEVLQLERQCKDLQKDIDVLEAKLKEAVEDGEKNKEELIRTQSKLEDKEGELVSAQESISNYVTTLGEYSNENNELKGQVNVLTEKVSILQNSLSAETEGLASEKNDLVEQLSTLKAEHEDTVLKYNQLIEKIYGLRQLLIDALACFTQAENMTINIETTDLDIILEAISTVLEKFKSTWDENERLFREKTDAENSYSDLQIQFNEQSGKIQLLEEKLSSCESLLSEKDNVILQQKVQIDNFETAKRTEFSTINAELAKTKNEKSLLENKVKNTDESLKQREEYVGQLSKQIIDLEKTVADMTLENTELKTTLQATKLSSNTGVAGTVSLARGYTGAAKIIQVFGSGSYGITSIAMTLAHRLVGKRVCYLDFDLVSPKADGWFGINPVCEGLTDIPQQLDKTGVAALLNNGTAYVLRNFDKIIKHKISQRDYVLDYFSGIYNTAVSSKIYAVDYSLLFNFLGERYDYIIVDSGRIGSSDAYDSVIRTINDMAHKNVVVTLNDKYDIRTQKVKMEYASIDLEKSIWVLNMAESNVIATDIRKMIGNMKITQLIRVLNYYGIKKPMDISVPMLKPKIDELVRNIV